MNPSPARRAQALVIVTALMFSGLPRVRADVPQLLSYQGRVTANGANVDKPGAFKFSLVDGGVDQSVAATATAEVNGDGRVREIHVTNPGSGYLEPPTVRLSGTGDRAEAVAVMNGDKVASISVIEGGSGFSQVTPTEVIISPPPANLKVTTYWSNDGTGAEGAEPTAAVTLDVRKGLYSVLLGQEGLMQPLPTGVFAHPDVRLRVWFNPDVRDAGNFTLLTPDQRIAAVGYALMAEAVRPGGVTSDMLAGDAVTMAQLSPEVRGALQSLQAWQATQLPVITSAGSIGGAVDYPVSYQITATGTPTSFSATGLPAGWSVNAVTGIVSGVPSATGTITFNVSATNVAGVAAPRAVTVTVVGGVYVDYATGADGNPGTSAAPVKTISQGLAIATATANVRPVLVSGAAQPLTATLTIPNGTQMKGGFDRAAGWTRTAPRTPLTYAPGTTLAAGANRAAVSATGLTKPVLLDGFSITCGGATGFEGGSIIGVMVKDCTSLTLSNDVISAGTAAPGAAGAAGTAGTNGGNGGNGAQALVNFSFVGGGGAGGTGPAGTGKGGKGGDGAYNQATPAGELVSVPPTAGANGGSIGSGLNQFFGGAGGAAGANGEIAGTPGAPGGPGVSAPPASNGAATLATLSLGEAWQPKVGNGGSSGGNGSGGGGGGGGGKKSNYGPSSGGGGGGGSGGSGGTGGKGGQSGGGSFGVMAIRSAVTVTGCLMVTGNGGSGGAGGNGGTGGQGGTGGTGYAANNPNGIGGAGGSGGHGGAGGGGSGGNGGPSIGIIAGAQSTVTESSNTFSIGNGGAGGVGGVRPSQPATQAPSGLPGVRQNVLTGVFP